MAKQWKKVENSNMFNFEENNNEIEGKYIGFTPADKNARKSSIITIETNEGEQTLYGSTVLDNKLKEATLGQNVRIVFLGKETSKTGTEYKNWDVFIEEDINE